MLQNKLRLPPFLVHFIAPTVVSSMIPVALDHVCTLLTDHNHWSVGVARHNPGHDRGVDDTQAWDAVHSAIDVAFWAHGTSLKNITKDANGTTRNNVSRTTAKQQLKSRFKNG